MQSVEFVLFFLQLYISCFRLVLRFLCNFCELLCRHSTTLRSHQQITWCQWPSSQFEWEPQRTYRSKMIQAMQQRITFFTKLFLLSRAYCITASVWLYSSKVCQNSCNELCQSVYLRAPVFVQFTEFTELQHVMLHPASLKTVLHAAPRTVGSVCPGCKCDWMLALQVLGSHGPLLARGKRHSHESS